MNVDKQFKRYYAKEVSSLSEGTACIVRGWIEDIRPLGKLTFITVRDRTGLAQIVLNKNIVGDETFKMGENLTRQSIIEVLGKAQKSKSQNVPMEVLAEKLTVLARTNPPFPIDPTGRVFSSLDKRLDARALDLRNPQVMAIFKIRHTVLKSIRETFYRLGFIEVNTPKIIGQAAEGGANLFKLSYFEKKAYLAQSPQLYKEQLTMSLEKVFEIAQYFRAEKSNTLRHVCEFTSLDMEAAYMDEFDVMDIAEEVVYNVIKDVEKENAEEIEILKIKLPKVERPFKKISYTEAIEKLREKKTIEWGEDLQTKDLRMLGRIFKEFYFIYHWPLAIKPFYIERLDDKLSKSFDLMYGYLELASGGKRVNNREELEKRLREQELDPKDFEYHLKAFDYGMPPHSGWGLGVDRLLMVVTGRNNIRETILYPRDPKRLVP
ncbi:MAG: aspartate--tRNA(Asn) ligase [Nitrososphaeria archaeon]|nr:aspartate--tRNA(Asn) ligase [Nitrososphaeria archaeon]